MGLLFFILIVLLIAQVGFWHALGAIVGAVAMLFLLAFLALGVLVVGGLFLVAGALR